jgi:hypothetical protein
MFMSPGRPDLKTTTLLSGDHEPLLSSRVVLITASGVNVCESGLRRDWKPSIVVRQTHVTAWLRRRQVKKRNRRFMAETEARSEGFVTGSKWFRIRRTRFLCHKF